jgi:hypothetical protein
MMRLRATSQDKSDPTCDGIGKSAHLARLTGVQRLRLIGVTTGGISTFGLAVLFASNCAGFRNITLH